MQESIYNLETGKGGLPRLTLPAPDGGRAQVYLQGAHLSSWQPPGMGEQLFLSPAARYEAGGLIRGGTPVCFPQFGLLGPLPMHGFVRRMPWQFDGVEPTTNGGAAAWLSVGDTPQILAVWPHPFQCKIRFQLEGPGLDIQLEVANTGESEMAFTGALHTYFRVASIGAAFVTGLEGLHYLDGGPQGSLEQQTEARLVSPHRLTRIYPDVPGPLHLDDGAHRLLIAQRGFSEVVVWNPGSERPPLLSDLGPQDDLAFVCLEAALVMRTIRLQPGEHWIGGQSVRVEDSLL